MFLLKLFRFYPSPRHLSRLLCRSSMNPSDRGYCLEAPPCIEGFALAPFACLEEIFRENFEMSWESAGAAFAVYHKGELVVDLYAGYTDDERNSRWSQSTMTHVFSITKSLSAIVLAMLIDKGRASYDDLVCQHWPEFAQNGKAGITIKQITQHEAGIPYGNEAFTVEDVLDPSKMSRKLERMTPIWIPGMKCGYHALTFGFLIDQIVRRIDPKKRGVVEFFQEEITNKYGVKDVFIGLADDQLNNRVAKVVEATDEQLLEEGRRNPEALRRFAFYNNEHWRRLYENWPWIRIPDYNKLENRRLPMLSNMGIGSARGVARVHALIVEGKLLSAKFLETIDQPQLISQHDIVNGYPESKGFGWQYTKNKLGKWIFGHSGYGGQNVRVDVGSQLAYAYVCNGLKAGDADCVDTFCRLQDALYDCLKRSQ
uniref:Beta-lactamase-related domain-containing protein n=1 Tax=Parascaris univalens TaxID=6257 RepID=A0A915A6H6_PARUN